MDEELECQWCAGPNLRRSSPYCSPLHQQKAKRDESYFNGNYRSAIGYDKRECQICLKKVDKGGQAHHVLGRGNDLEGLWLVWLCPGCHDLVTKLAIRKFVDDPLALARLVRYSWIRRHGREPKPDIEIEVSFK